MGTLQLATAQVTAPAVVWNCASCDLCGMNNSAFTPRDTHKCKTCGKRVHGILCCVPQTEDEEGTGNMYCKKCGRPGETPIPAPTPAPTAVLPAATNPVITQQSQQQSYETQLERSVFLEQKFSQDDPNHCMDMNPSSDVCADIIQRFQSSQRRNEAIEKRMLENKRLHREERSDNRLMGMLATRVTAGTLASHGEHDISQKELLELMEAKNKKREDSERAKLEKKIERDTKIYEEGMAAKLKALEHKKIVQERLAPGSCDLAGRIMVIRKAKREKKWLNNTDFLALLKFKKLGMKESNKPIPVRKDDREHLWFTKYQYIPDPADPRLGIQTVLEEEDEVVVDNGDEEVVVDPEVDGADDAFYDV